jgi:hypothetical protein
MDTLDKDIEELRERLSEGSIRRAYRGIVSYMSRLRSMRVVGSALDIGHYLEA